MNNIIYHSNLKWVDSCSAFFKPDLVTICTINSTEEQVFATGIWQIWYASTNARPKNMLQSCDTLKILKYAGVSSFPSPTGQSHMRVTLKRCLLSCDFHSMSRHLIFWAVTKGILRTWGSIIYSKEKRKEGMSSTLHPLVIILKVHHADRP